MQACRRQGSQEIQWKPKDIFRQKRKTGEWRMPLMCIRTAWILIVGTPAAEF